MILYCFSHLENSRKRLFIGIFNKNWKCYANLIEDYYIQQFDVQTDKSIISYSNMIDSGLILVLEYICNEMIHDADSDKYRLLTKFII